MIKTFDFYDTETSGINSKHDQILQLASVKTDMDLNIIKGSELNVLCKPRMDIVPSPMAFLTHRLDINDLTTRGVSEFELSQILTNRFISEEANCISGYNTNSFDNEFIRNLFFRNMNNVYDFEWVNENKKFDIYSLVQTVLALRPNLLQWKKKNNGEISLKLEDLSESNGISHDKKHDAFGDTLATVSLAKIIKEKNPKLFNYAFNLSNKNNVRNFLNEKKPLVHISPFYTQKNNLLSLIFPIFIDIENKNKYHCLDLRHDPSIILDLSPTEIHEKLFKKESDAKIPIIGICTNKQPNIFDGKGLLTEDIVKKSRLSKIEIAKNLGFIKKHQKEIMEKIKNFSLIKTEKENEDVYGSLYSGGFISTKDTLLRNNLHKGSPEPLITSIDVEQYSKSFLDKRHYELVLRAKWNSFYEFLLTSKNFNTHEFVEWKKFIQLKLNNITDRTILSISGFNEEIKRIKEEMELTEKDLSILEDIQKFVKKIIKFSK